MSDEKQLSLSDLGIKKEITPAEKAEIEHINDPNGNELTQITPSNDVEKHFTEDEEPKKHIIPKPDKNQRENPNNKMTIIQDVNSIAKNPIKKDKDPIRKTMDTLYDLMDKGIERTKQELTKPGGRIDQAKQGYIKQKYDQLMERAKKNKNLENKIKALNDIIDTDARFDDISDYERHGYILFKIARDEQTGVNDKYFGIISDSSKERRFRNSHEAAEEIGKIDEDPMDDIYDDSNTTILSDDQPVIPFKDEKYIEEEKDTSLELEEDFTSDSNLLNEEAEENISNEEIELETPDEDDETDDEIMISDEQQKKILMSYKHQLEEALSLNKTNDIEGFSISDRPIKLNNALAGNSVRQTTVWGLQFSGNAIEMTPFSGEELIMLNPQQTAYNTVAGLRTVFSIIWRHIANPKKPPFDLWLKQISDYDVDCLLFAVYVANFKDTNIITYECPSKKCKNVFIKKYDVEDMLIYPNDKIKKDFHNILRKDTEVTSLYRTRPVPINNQYAIGFVTQSVYSNLFEPASLSDEFTKKYRAIIDIMPNIDTVYKIDAASRTLVPISFGKFDNLEKFVMRKVKGLVQIMKHFTPDERAIVISEAGKISATFNSERIQYRLPATTCPVCGEKIEEQVVTPLDLLFMRAQLPIVAASIQE